MTGDSREDLLGKDCRYGALDSESLFMGKEVRGENGSDCRSPSGYKQRGMRAMRFNVQSTRSGLTVQVI
jgi:hypothetical protein